MTITGSGQGNEIGNADRMTSQVEKDTSPFVTVNKAALALVTDSLELSFTKFGGNVWSYQASPDQPLLAGPLLNIRMQTGSKTAEDQSWKGIYDELKNELPTDVAIRLSSEQSKKEEDKNTSYLALDSILTQTAKTIAAVQNAAKPPPPQSKTALDALKNSEMAKNLATSLSDKGKALLDGSTQFLNGMGANYPHFDHLSTTLKQIQKEL